jgi:hypothetical protein
MKKLFLAILVIVFPCILTAQTTTVNGTVVDPDSFAWIGATITFTLNNPHPETKPSINGVPMTAAQLVVSATLDSAGAFTAVVSSNATISPIATSWNIQICTPTNTPCQNISAQQINGSTLSLSSTINGQIKALRFPAIAGARGYGDVEITPIPISGSTYFNITTGFVRLWNGTSWSNQGSSSGCPLSGCAFTGPVTGPSANFEMLANDFYVSAFPSSCAGGGTTDLECAWIAANTWANTFSANPLIHLKAGVNNTTTGLATDTAFVPSIEGSGSFGSLIRQTATISNPVLKYGCDVVASSINLKNFQIDADFNAPSTLYLGKSQEFDLEGVVNLGAVGTGANSNFVQFGDPTCSPEGSTFEGHVKHLTTTARGTGPTSWAVATCSQSGGTPSCSISNGGTYHWNTSPAYLVGYGTGSTATKPCTTMGTVTPTFTTNGTWVWGQTFYQQTLNTYTLSSVSLSGFSGCTGNMYLFVPDQLPPAYGLYLPFSTDMVFDMYVSAGAGQTAGVLNGNTANVFNGLHIYNSHVGYKSTAGGGRIYGYDCDSNLIMMQLSGSVPMQENGCNLFYPSAAIGIYKGALFADLSGDTGHQSVFVNNSIVGSQPTDFHAFLNPAGPSDTTGTWPGSTVDRDSPTLNNNGNLKHDTSTQVVVDTTAPEVLATASANQNMPQKLFCTDLWNGTGPQQNCWTVQMQTSTSGVPSQEIFAITPPSNFLAPISGLFFLLGAPGNATVGTNLNSITEGLRGSYNDGTTPHGIGWNWTVQIGSGATPDNTLFFSPTLCLSGNCPLAANTFKSTVATGTAPLQVTSTTPVSNLSLASDTQLPTNVTPGSCTNCSATFNAQGIATAYATASAVLRTASGYCTGTATSSAANLSVTNLGGNNFACTGTFGAAGMLMIGSGSLSNLSVRCNTTGINTSSGLFTLHSLRAGSDSPTGLTVTYGTTAGGTMVQDTTHTFSYLPGDMLRLEYTTQASETLANCDVSFNY